MDATQFAAIWIGVTLIGAGALAVAAWVLRGRRDGLVLLSLGACCVLYGLRLLAFQPPVRAALGGNLRGWRYFLQFATYAINVPAMLFFVGVLGAGWRRTLHGVVAGQALYAAAAIAIDLAAGRPGAANGPNSAIVLLGFAIGVANFVYRYRRGQRSTLLTDPVVMVGAVVFLIFVANENLGPLVAPDLNLEPLGVLVFMLCLGYAVVRSVVRNEAEFVSVQRELDTARRIQSSLLPRNMPSVAGIDLAVRYVPMTAVAGDFYDVIQVGPTAVGVLVADVSGHGIPAALVASMVKVAFGAQSAHAADPAAVLSSMNRILCRHLEHAYVTAVYAVIDAAGRGITLARAGHPPPLLQRVGEPIQRIDDAGGLILGFVQEAGYTNTCIHGLRSGDRLLLYTDGVLEARDRTGQFFDEERTARWLSTNQGSSADEVAQAALVDLTRWSGAARFDDDVTFVLVETTG
ncbi:MAG TPA: PP2C family protein-serine/threonine phosphatase [Vicinamibacterales bacterium]|jgi:sigma-B regulation protein RsbU (phosphoserine phosphatase)|nr:PP2C family protein-serine/threonine phosphatase [Vicinamibacterales bacterium]